VTAFDIDRFVFLIGSEYEKWKAPIVSHLAKRADATPFQVLVSTLLSLRTKDEVTAAAASRLFESAKTPEAIVSLSKEAIEALIYPVGFYHTKAERLKTVSRILIDQYDGDVPNTMNALIALPGVGRKTANLVLVEGFGKPGICVDTHVHRISNRVGYVDTTAPDETEMQLRKQLPVKYWRRYNEMLVAFGQMVCRPVSPFCSRCPVAVMCPQIAVGRHR